MVDGCGSEQGEGHLSLSDDLVNLGRVVYRVWLMAITVFFITLVQSLIKGKSVTGRFGPLPTLNPSTFQLMCVQLSRRYALHCAHLARYTCIARNFLFK